MTSWGRLRHTYHDAYAMIPLPHAKFTQQCDAIGVVWHADTRLARACWPGRTYEYDTVEVLE